MKGLFARVPESTYDEIHKIAKSRGEKLQETVAKALDQYAASIRRKRAA